MDAEGIHIPHNRIHRFLKEKGLAQDEPRKQRRRKWFIHNGISCSSIFGRLKREYEKQFKKTL